MTSADIRPLVAGNWKMNGLRANLEELRVVASAMSAKSGVACDVGICPPFTLLSAAADIVAGSPVALGGQDCHAAASGAHTGDIAPEMLADAGCSLVILGHSERRADHGETDAVVRAKVEGAWRADLTAIVCVGETESQRDKGEALSVVLGQIDGSLPAAATARNTVIAYEPVWAIGTGRVAGDGDIHRMHGAIRRHLSERFNGGADIRILYGGSVKPDNATGIAAIADVDGALVGGASLKAEDFNAIIAAFNASRA